MYKITKIIEIQPYFIICEVNDVFVKKINVEDLMKNHSHFKGIENLKNNEIFNSAEIGIMGEIFWKDLIEINSEIWNYDISPEFIMEFGEDIKMA